MKERADVPSPPSLVRGLVDLPHVVELEDVADKRAIPEQRIERAEDADLVVLNTCPHPLDPAPLWQPRPITVDIVRVPPAGPDDRCRLHCAENGRGYANTARYLCQDPVGAGA